MSTQTDVDMYKNEYTTRHYSEAFKLKILSELSSGKYSKRGLWRIYGLCPSTINECNNLVSNEKVTIPILLSMKNYTL